MHSLLLAGAGLATIPFINTNRDCANQNFVKEASMVAPQDGTIYLSNYPKDFDISKLNSKSTTYLKNKSAISLLSKIK